MRVIRNLRLGKLRGTVQQPHRPPRQCPVGGKQRRRSPAKHRLLSLRAGVQRQQPVRQPIPLQRKGTRRLHRRHLLPRHPRLRSTTLRPSHRTMDTIDVCFLCQNGTLPLSPKCLSGHRRNPHGWQIKAFVR